MPAEFSTLALASDPNLKAYWKLEDTADSSGNSATLTNNGSATFVAAKFNNGGSLGTSNSSKWFSRASNLGVDGTGAFSIAFWIKGLTEIGSGAYHLFQHDSTGGADRYIALYYEYNSGTRRLSLDPAGGTAVNSNLTLGTSDIKHIGVTRSAGGAVIMYVDGASVGSTTAGTGGGGGDNSIALGRHPTVSANYASSLFDDVVVFDRVLTAVEMNTIFTGSPPTEASGIIII